MIWKILSLVAVYFGHNMELEQNSFKKVFMLTIFLIWEYWNII
jgi:hypothetical protein